MFTRSEKPIARWPALVVLLACAALAGCQNTPTVPLAEVPDPSQALGAGGIQWVVASHRGTAAPLSLQDTGDRTFWLNGYLGGTLSYGRFTLTFPAGAVYGWAQVTIHVPASALVDCDLSITPAYLNHFYKPVVLTIDCHGTNVTADNISGLGIYWKSTNGQWVEVGHDDDPMTLTVSAPLQHFSEYRSGW
ncbi:MAG TPA: hypothetical protein VMS93_00080 [Candidatus Saccharimonadales bacterium]|nr:hypothetical protein [Candidatus Saccharimonadales bacterium]